MMKFLGKWRRGARRWWSRWSTVAIAITVSTVLALLGLIGAGTEQPLRGERFDRKQIVIRPAPPNGVRITEVVDIDFGRFDRHGYQRILPTDAGEPLGVKATSTANARVETTPVRGSSYYSTQGPLEGYQIRVGSPDRTWRGRQRYTLSYTLPEMDLRSGALGLDVIGADDNMPTGELDIWLVGFEFDTVECWIGRWASTDECAVESVTEGYLIHIDDLKSHNGVTVAGQKSSGGVVSDEPIVEPKLAGRVRQPWSLHWLTAAVVLLAGLLTVAVLLAIRFLLGVDRVAEGDGIAAAFPDGLDGVNGVNGVNSDPGTSRWCRSPEIDVPDDMTTTKGLAEHAATEFAPPDGVRPWQAAILINEAVDDRSLRAWFSEMIARGALVPSLAGTDQPSKLRGLTIGDPKVIDALSETDREMIGSLFATSKIVRLDRYSLALRNASERLVSEQNRFVIRSRWWRRRRPQFNAAPLRRVNWSVVSFILAIYLVAGWFLTKTFLGPFSLFGLVLAPLPMAAALVVAWVIWASSRRISDAPSRSVLGSAIAIRVLGFRKFLLGSEGSHVDAAWDRSRVREYSAWAIALDAAEAWSNQIDTQHVPQPELEQLNVYAALGSMLSRIEFKLDTHYDSSSRHRANPWRTTGELITSAARHMGESKGSGWSSGSSRSFSSGGRSVGSGRGGGSSGSW